GLVKAPLVTGTGARNGGWLAGLRATPGRLRASVALVVLLACGLGLLTGSDPALAADQRQDLALYASDQQHAEQDLQQVAVTAAGDPAAQRAVSSVLDALG